MSDEFKPGDLVEMKTGSPTMIYIGQNNDGDALCERFDKEERKVKREIVHPSSLKNLSALKAG